MLTNEIKEEHKTVILAAALAISENGKVSFEAAGAAAFAGHSYAVGRLLLPKKKVEPRAFMATMGSLWGLRNHLTILPQGDRYVLRFQEEADRKELLKSGPYFYGKTVFALAEYDGRSDAVLVPITSVPVWVEVSGLPMDLWTKKALYMVGSMLGKVIHHDNQCLIHGKKARVRIEHQISSPVKQAFPPMLFEFGKGKDLIAAMLTFKYERPWETLKSSATVTEDGVAELGPVLELSLPHLAGSLVISTPKKRKVGRPYGKKNKPKVVEINPWKLEANAKAKSSKKKRSFGSTRHSLTLGDEDSASTASEIMAVEAIEDQGDVPSM
ncbi:hypothetical protein ACLB2K_010973 [Fragaria x ananassa]